MRKLTIIFIAILMLFTAACQEGLANEPDEPETPTELSLENVLEIKNAYIENDPRVADTANDVKVELIKFYGNNPLVWATGSNELYIQAFTTVECAGYAISFPTGQHPYLYADGKFYSINQAYSEGLLTTTDIQDIAKTFADGISPKAQ